MGSYIFSFGQMADVFLRVDDLVGRFLRVSGMSSLVEVLPLIRGAWEGAHLQHCVRCNEQKGRVCDGIFFCSSPRFILGDLESVYVLEDAIAVNVVFLHFGLQIPDVDCVQSTTDGLEVGEDLFGGYRCEESLFILQVQRPCLVYSVDYEGLFFELRFGKNIVIRDASPPDYFFFTENDSFFVFLDARIVDLWPHRDG